MDDRDFWQKNNFFIQTYKIVWWQITYNHLFMIHTLLSVIIISNNFFQDFSSNSEFIENTTYIVIYVAYSNLQPFNNVWYPPWKGLSIFHRYYIQYYFCHRNSCYFSTKNISKSINLSLLWEIPCKKYTNTM